MLEQIHQFYTASLSEPTAHSGATCDLLWGLGLRLRRSEDGASLAPGRSQMSVHRQVLLTRQHHCYD